MSEEPPVERSITPAPEDYRTVAGLGAWLWPIAWLALAVLLVAWVRGQGWPAFGEHGHAAPGHERPAHGDPLGGV